MPMTSKASVSKVKHRENQSAPKSSEEKEISIKLVQLRSLPSTSVSIPAPSCRIFTSAEKV